MDMKSKIIIATFTFMIFSINVIGQNSAKSESVMLEIKTQAIGMVIPEGELLDFRLYEDGRFEYDKLADLIRNPRANPQVTRKASKLSAEQLREIDNLIKDPETLSAKPRYETIR